MSEKKGFRLPRRTATIKFTGKDTDGFSYEGAEVEVFLDVPMELFFEFQGHVETDDNLAIFGLFAREALSSWNLHDDEGAPIPATIEGLNKIWPNFARLLIEQWMGSVMAPRAPLSVLSGNGATLDEASIPMEPLAASPGSYSEPR